MSVSWRAFVLYLRYFYLKPDIDIPAFNDFIMHGWACVLAEQIRKLIDSSVSRSCGLSKLHSSPRFKASVTVTAILNGHTKATTTESWPRKSWGSRFYSETVRAVSQHGDFQSRLGHGHGHGHGIFILATHPEETWLSSKVSRQWSLNHWMLSLSLAFTASWVPRSSVATLGSLCGFNSQLISILSRSPSNTLCFESLRRSCQVTVP